MKQHRLLAFCAIALALVIAVANIVLGNLNLDEGWYLQAAANVAAGKMPYRDFFFTQAPLLPRVYGLLLPLWAPAGVLGGRIVTAVIGLFAALHAAAAVRLLVPAPRRFAAGMGNTKDAFISDGPLVWGWGCFPYYTPFCAKTQEAEWRRSCFGAEPGPRRPRSAGRACGVF